MIGIPVPTIALFPGVELDLTSNFVFYYVVLAVICPDLRRHAPDPRHTGFGRCCAPFATMPIAFLTSATIRSGTSSPGLSAGGADRRLRRPDLSAAARLRGAASVRLRSIDQGRGDVAGRRRRHAARPAHAAASSSPFCESMIGSYTERHLFVLGIIFIVFVMFLPDGLCGLVQRLATRRKAGTMIKVAQSEQGLRRAAGGRRPQLRGERNRITSIIGPNGAGKSTAFNLIAGTLRPDSGAVTLDGRDITGKPPYDAGRLGVARSFQITNLFFGLTRARERAARLPESLSGAAAISCGSTGWRIAGARRRELLERVRPRRAGGRTGRQPLARRPAAGRDRGLHGARAQAPDARRADAGHVAGRDRARSTALIKSLAGRVTVLLIEHDIDLVMSLSDHVIVMHQGRKLFEGTPAAVRASPAVRHAYLGSIMPLLEVAALHARYALRAGAAGRLVFRGCRRDRQHLRPQRRRQDHDAAHDSWAGCGRPRARSRSTVKTSAGCRRPHLPQRHRLHPGGSPHLRDADRGGEPDARPLQPVAERRRAPTAPPRPGDLAVSAPAASDGASSARRCPAASSRCSRSAAR